MNTSFTSTWANLDEANLSHYARKFNERQTNLARAAYENLMDVASNLVDQIEDGHTDVTFAELHELNTIAKAITLETPDCHKQLEAWMGRVWKRLGKFEQNLLTDALQTICPHDDVTSDEYATSNPDVSVTIDKCTCCMKEFDHEPEMPDYEDYLDRVLGL